MSYHLYRFGPSVYLPTGQSVDGLGAEVPSDVTATAGVPHFAYGSGIVPLGVHRVSHRGTFSPLDPAGTVKTNVDAMMGMIGERRPLWRYLEGSNPVTIQWKYARLLSCRWDRDVEQHQHAEISSEFEAVGYWKKSSLSDASYSTGGVGGTGLFTPTGEGTVPVYDPVITYTSIETNARTIILRFQDTVGQIDWTWSGSVAVDGKVVIDCGAFSVLNDGVNAYAGFTLEDGTSDQGQAAPHASDYWCVILPGTGTREAPTNNAFTLDLVDGGGNGGNSLGGTFEVEWYDSWA